jgi:hypothetical protein
MNSLCVLSSLRLSKSFEMWIANISKLKIYLHDQFQYGGLKNCLDIGKLTLFELEMLWLQKSFEVWITNFNKLKIKLQ